MHPPGPNITRFVNHPLASSLAPIAFVKLSYSVGARPLGGGGGVVSEHNPTLANCCRCRNGMLLLPYPAEKKLSHAKTRGEQDLAKGRRKCCVRWSTPTAEGLVGTLSRGSQIPHRPRDTVSGHQFAGGPRVAARARGAAT